MSSELTKLRQAERSLASIVEGTSIDEAVDDQPKRHRASADDVQPRAGRGAPRGPRANSAKGRLKALLEEAGSQGLTHAQITDRLHDVAANTLATYLSVMTASGELERRGDFYRAGAPAADAKPHASDNEELANAEEVQENSDQAEAAE